MRLEISSHIRMVKMKTCLLSILGKECVLAPEIGNFPHMSGTNNPVKITSISSTRNDDNAGMDIKEVISRYNDWGHNPT